MNPFQQWLAAMGLDENTLTAEQKVKLKAKFDAEQAPPAPPAPAAKPAVASTFSDKLSAIEAENERQVAINEAVVNACNASIGNSQRIKDIRALGEAAVADQKVTAKDFALSLFQLQHTLGPVVIAGGRKDEAMTSEVLEAALCVQSRLPNVEKVFKERTLEAAHKAYPHGVSLLEMIGIAAKRNGWRGHSVKSDLRNALRCAFNGNSNLDIMAGVSASTLDITGILSNTANKFVRIAFEAVENAWSQFAATRPVNDFKEITSYSLTGDLTYDQVAPGGEIKHGTLGETSYTNKADTYGKLIGIDRRDLINDDLSALSSVSRRLGRGGALKINDIFWRVWLDDSSFFSTGNSNYDDGAVDSVLSLAGLENARNIFMLQTDPDGKPLGSMPKILLVPTSLGITARNLMNGLFTASAQSTATVTTANVFQGMFRIVESTYLQNSSYTGYSATAWYLLADPDDLPAIEVCFLNGQQMPTIETADMDFDRLGIALRGYHDFGARKQEYRAGVKLKGAA